MTACVTFPGIHHDLTRHLPNTAAPKAIVIDVNSSRPGLGKTLIAGIIARALADVGFINLTINSAEDDVDAASHNVTERTVKDAVLLNPIVINDMNGTEQRDQITALATDLAQAAATLRYYEAQHRAKGTVESSEKAEANAVLAARFEATLASLNGVRPNQSQEAQPLITATAADPAPVTTPGFHPADAVPPAAV